MSALTPLTTLVRLDAKLAARTKLLHVTVGVALVFGALLAFAVPDQLDLTGSGPSSQLPALAEAPEVSNRSVCIYMTMV